MTHTLRHQSRANNYSHVSYQLKKKFFFDFQPPENELQKVGERVPSEHELRVQRSLQRLNVPDWYKNSPAARDGFRLKRHSDASQHGGWRALGSKTTSLSSLSSSSNRQPTTGKTLLPCFVSVLCSFLLSFSFFFLTSFNFIPFHRSEGIKTKTILSDRKSV